MIGKLCSSSSIYTLISKANATSLIRSTTDEIEMTQFVIESLCWKYVRVGNAS